MSTPPLVLYVLSTPVASIDFSGFGRSFPPNNASEANNTKAAERTAVNTGRMENIATSLGSEPVDGGGTAKTIIAEKSIVEPEKCLARYTRVHADAAVAQSLVQMPCARSRLLFVSSSMSSFNSSLPSSVWIAVERDNHGSEE